jgi:chromosome segregation ATPase
VLANNLARKTALAEKAEALKDSTDWKEATEAFVEMQKEWKTIGTVAKKYSDTVWKRFLNACDYFFEQKKKATSGSRRAEADNLKAKKAVIAELDTITDDMSRDDAIAKLRELQAKWQEIGHVPFRDKDKVYAAFREKVDALRDKLNMRRAQARMERFTESISDIEGDSNKLYRERERLVRALEARQQELRTYENNLGFLSAKSKSGDSMLREFERKAANIRADIEDLRGKIKLIDEKL